jgi:hypothetical protein
MRKAKKKPKNAVPKSKRSLREDPESNEDRLLSELDLRRRGQVRYVFYARNSCHRNHNHYTLCAHHHNEEHERD